MHEQGDVTDVSRLEKQLERQRYLDELREMYHPVGEKYWEMDER